MFVRKNLSEVRYAEIVHLTTKCCLRIIFMQSLPKSSKTLPNHHLGPTRGYWVCSCEKIRWGFGTPKQYVRVPKNTLFASIFVQEVAKRTKTLTIIVLGLTEVIGCVRAKKFVRSSVCRNCAFGHETLFSHHFSCSRYQILQNTPKTSFRA